MRNVLYTLTFLVLASLLEACGPTGTTGAAVGAPATSGTAAAPTAAAEESDTRPAEVQTAPPSPRAAPNPLAGLGFGLSGWKTDFSKHSIPLDEIRSGGPPRDGIPPIDKPAFIQPAEAGAWLKDNEPVIAVELNGDARAYPLQILIWHEIVNDTLGGVPVAVTFCPLCNSAIAFDRRVEGIEQPLRFGTTGNLRHSDLVMWSDDPGETWWQQLTGEAIVGALTGTRLEMLPAQIVSFADFKATFPNGQVLSRETGFQRSYGSNPYTGYDDVNSSPFLFSGRPDERLRPMERVVAVELDGEAVAFPFRVLQQRGVLAERVGGTPIVVFWAPGTASALDRASIPGSRDIGATGVFRPSVDGRPLTFEQRDGTIVDHETGSTWNVLGQATAGPLVGKQLERVVHGDHFWFAWGAFKPETRVIE